MKCCPCMLLLSAFWIKIDYMYGDKGLRNSSGLLACLHDCLLLVVEDEHNLNKSHESLLVAAK